MNVINVQILNRPMIYCKKCVYPAAAVNLSIDEEGICSSCRFYEKYNSITEEKWKERKKKLK